jgi:hypothetical protein
MARRCHALYLDLACGCRIGYYATDICLCQSLVCPGTGKVRWRGTKEA